MAVYMESWKVSDCIYVKVTTNWQCTYNQINKREKIWLEWNSERLVMKEYTIFWLFILASNG